MSVLARPPDGDSLPGEALDGLYSFNTSASWRERTRINRTVRAVEVFLSRFVFVVLLNNYMSLGLSARNTGLHRCCVSFRSTRQNGVSRSVLLPGTFLGLTTSVSKVTKQFAVVVVGCGVV